MDLSQPFKPPEKPKARTSEEELGHNLERWLQAATKELPEDVDFVFVMKLKGQDPGNNIMGGNMSEDQTRRELQETSRKMRHLHGI